MRRLRDVRDDSRRSEFAKLETDDGLAAKATVAQLFEHLAGAVQCLAL
jgi:hypothetical protein